jgi:hypothetical protein
MFASGGREAIVRVSGSELPIPFNALFNGVNHCGVQVSTPHSVGFARLASEAFYCAGWFSTFYGFIKFYGKKR